jgi:hypothetical protein
MVSIETSRNMFYCFQHQQGIRRLRRRLELLGTGRRQERGMKMSLLLIVEVEPFEVNWDLNHVEKGLEVCISVERAEKFIKGNIDKLRMSVKPVDKQSDVSIATSCGESAVASNTEFSRFFNLGRPSLLVVVLHNNWVNHHRSRSSRHPGLQISNLKHFFSSRDE